MTEIRKIDAPSPSAFTRHYLLPRVPVVVRNLFAGDELATLVTKRAVLEKLGDLPVYPTPEHFRHFEVTSSFVAPPPSGKLPMLRTYFTGPPMKDAVSQLICTELAIPPQLRALFRIPRHCLDRRSLHSAPDDRIVGFLFAGRKGCVAHLHFDGDQRHVFLHQLFGTKRIVLIPPDKGHLLAPLFNFSMLSIEEMNSRERRAFFRATGARECALEAGETLYVPPLTWHFLEYRADAMSFNLRFGRSKRARTLARLPPNVYLQWLSDALHAGRRLKLGRARTWRKLSSFTKQVDEIRWGKPAYVTYIRTLREMVPWA